MAGYSHASLPHPQITPNSHLGPSVLATEQLLPAGKCSFRDLGSGTTSQICGCRRFWLNHAAPSQNLRGGSPPAPSMETAWCFCGHHACYHDIAHSQSPTESSLVPLEHPQATAQPSIAWGSAHSQRQHLLAPGLGLYLSGGKASKRAMPASPLGHTFYKSQQMHPAQDSPRPPSDVSSLSAPQAVRQSPSRAFLTHIESRRRLAPKLEIAPDPRQELLDDCAQSATEAATPSQFGDIALQDADEAVRNVCDCLDNLTQEYCTKSHEAKPLACHSMARLTEPVIEAAQHSASLVEQLLVHIQALKHILSSRPGLMSSISDLDKRMDALETMSYNHGSMDEVNDRFEQFDGRLLEIEGKVDELERHQPVTEVNFARKAAASSSTKLVHSFDSEMTDVDTLGAPVKHMPNHVQRLHDLEQRLTELEASGLPSVLHPWVVEVVVLPWGHDLKGIWSTENEASQASRLAKQESAGFSLANRAPMEHHGESQSQTARAKSALAGRIAPEWPGTDRSLLWARACGATSGTGGRVYQRLKSRGFVRTTAFSSNDARHIHATICEMFGDLLEASRPQEIDGSNSLLRYPTLFGLQSPFVPLRKVHRSSRLRFLSLPELASPLLWTGDFLDTDIFMKAPVAGLRRLFITMPAAYLQSTKRHGWTWQKIRELPRTDTQQNADSSNQVLEGNANEPCWIWDAKLDDVPISVPSSFAALDSFQKHASFSSSHPLSPEKTEWLSGSDSDHDSHSDCDLNTAEAPASRSRGLVGPVTPVSEAAPIAMRRTVSVPTSSRMKLPEQHFGRRQTSSFEPAPPRAPQKRPRASPSPDDIAQAARGRWGLTPRRSHEPGSPAAILVGLKDAHETLSSGDQSMAPYTKRGITPSAYATPFSNSFAPIGGLGNSWAAGDTDLDSSSDSEYDGGVNEERDIEFDEVDVADIAFDRATMLEEDAWEGVGGDASDEEEREQPNYDHGSSSDNGSTYTNDDEDDEAVESDESE